MTPLQELTKKIQAHCPELLELTFGCEIIIADIANDNPGCERDVVLYGTQEQRDKGFVATEYYGQVPIAGIESILGHPITLEHVLKAMGASKKDISVGVSFRGAYAILTPTGNTIQNEHVNLLGRSYDIDLCHWQWQLGLPLHLQSEPLINWLNTVIK